VAIVLYECVKCGKLYDPFIEGKESEISREKLVAITLQLQAGSVTVKNDVCCKCWGTKDIMDGSAGIPLNNSLGHAVCQIPTIDNAVGAEPVEKPDPDGVAKLAKYWFGEAFAGIREEKKC
jgi:hypothetical protein